jgi:hypothetical protein
MVIVLDLVLGITLAELAKVALHVLARKLHDRRNGGKCKYVGCG